LKVEKKGNKEGKKREGKAITPPLCPVSFFYSFFLKKRKKKRETGSVLTIKTLKARPDLLLAR
jgi:hypothetical protein